MCKRKYFWLAPCLLVLVAIPVASVGAADWAVDGSIMVGANANVSGNSVLTGNLNAGGSVLSVNAAQRNVGVGTASPQYTMDIFQNGDQNVVARYGVWTNISSSSFGRGVFGSNFYYYSDATGYGYKYTNTHASLGYSGMVTDWGKIWFTNSSGATVAGQLFNPNVNMMIDTNGNVGIGAATPNTRLDVNGVICVRPYAGALQPGSNGYIALGDWGLGTGIYAANGSTLKRLTSHADPRDVELSASTSFADKAVELPFSFAHSDALIGKGQIVDLAKMVAFVEKQMKSQLGEKAGKLVYTFDLPTSATISLDKYQKQQSEQQAQEILNKVAGMPWIKVALGADGRVPDEAFTEVPVYETVMKKKKVAIRELDLKSRRMIASEREEDVPVQVATDRKETRLRPEYRVENGELYRKPTLNDINIDAMIKDTPQIPRWILERISTGQRTSMDVQELAGQIRRLLEARAAEQAQNQQAAVNE